MKRFIFLIAAVALGISLYWLTRIDEDPGPARSVAARKPVNAAQIAPSRRAPDPLPLAESAARRTDDAAAEPSGAKRTPSTPEVRERFDAVFGAEAVDASWSGRAADALAKSVQALLPAGSTLRRVECRGTLCRIETLHADVDGFRTYAQDAFVHRETRVGASGFFASLVGEPAPGEPVVGVVYLAREGKQLPGPDALFAAQ